jgi:hypothetical protein
LWRIPWHYARYKVDCRYNTQCKTYDKFQFTQQSDWAAAEIELEDTGKPMALTPGFSALDEQILILTHPVTGYFYLLSTKRGLSGGRRLNSRLPDNRPKPEPPKPASVGTYSVWHEEIPLTVGKAKHLYFSLYERLGLLSREEMQKPHSVLICPRTTFEVHLPPRRVA